MKQVIFENARIELFQREKNSSKDENISTVDDIISVVNGSFMPDLKIKYITSIVFNSVEIQILSVVGKVLTNIKARSAEFDAQNRQINFTGNVRIKSGPATLFTQTFLIVSKSGKAFARNGYHIMTPEKNIKGNKLLTDIFLTEFQNSNKGES
jgi:lipopolysaccharide assembly outer membrane protein LptD (OstA)